MMQKKDYLYTKRAAYFSYLAMSTVFSLPPLLFGAFRELYDISYTLLGTLVLINFSIQLIVDLIFSFFSKYFNSHMTIRVMPLVTSLGLCLYAVVPVLFPQYAYAGLVVGTVVFSVASGLAEVLVSPMIAALPSDHPERDMSNLHSLYAYGFVSVVVISTLFLRFIGIENWMYLAFFWAALPVIASVLLHRAVLPEMNTEQGVQTKEKTKYRTKGLLLCMACIFLGAAAENTMANWISVYVEKALALPKVWGDLLGMSAFAIVLGLTRTVYAKYGKNIFKVLMWGMTAASVCYLIIVFSKNTVVSVAACVLVGLCTSMLWPGTLILMEEKIPNVGVAAYALMAAGGDCGSSVAPQLLGGVVDIVTESPWAARTGAVLSLSAEQIGMKAGMLSAAMFPILGVLVLLVMKRFFKRAAC